MEMVWKKSKFLFKNDILNYVWAEQKTEDLHLLS